MAILIQATARPCGSVATKSTAPQAIKSQDSCQQKRIASWRHGLAATAAACVLVVSNPATASGIESIDLPSPPEVPSLGAWAAANRAEFKSEEERFESSDLLKQLREKSDLNREKNKQEIFDKNCRRQAEIGVGDCGGLRLIPGATQSGKQKTPQWIGKMMGMSEEELNSYNSSGDRIPDFKEGAMPLKSSPK